MHLQGKRILVVLSINIVGIIFLNKFIDLLIHGRAGLPCCWDFSLVAVSRGYSPGAVYGLLNEIASLVTEHRSRALWLQRLQFPSSRAHAR